MKLFRKELLGVANEYSRCPNELCPEQATAVYKPEKIRNKQDTHRAHQEARQKCRR